MHNWSSSKTYIKTNKIILLVRHIFLFHNNNKISFTMNPKMLITSWDCYEHTFILRLLWTCVCLHTHTHTHTQNHTKKLRNKEKSIISSILKNKITAMASAKDYVLKKKKNLFTGSFTVLSFTIEKKLRNQGKINYQ